MESATMPLVVASQDEISSEIGEIATAWKRNGRAGDQPRIDYPP